MSLIALEIVEVDAEQGDMAAAPLGQPQLVVEMLVEIGAVGQAGQQIVEGEMRDPLLALGDVGRHAVEARGEPAELVLAADRHARELAVGELPAAASSSEIGRVIDRAMRHVANTTKPRPKMPVTAIAIWSGR